MRKYISPPVIKMLIVALLLLACIVFLKGIKHGRNYNYQTKNEVVDPVIIYNAFQLESPHHIDTNNDSGALPAIVIGSVRRWL